MLHGNGIHARTVTSLFGLESQTITYTSAMTEVNEVTKPNHKLVLEVM